MDGDSVRLAFSSGHWTGSSKKDITYAMASSRLGYMLDDHTAAYAKAFRANCRPFISEGELADICEEIVKRAVAAIAVLNA